MKKRGTIFFIVILMVCIFAFSFDVRLKTVAYNVKSSKINSEIKLALVTDLHSCYYGKNQTKLIEKIEEYQPDVVLLGGDIFDDALDDNNTHIFLEALVPKYKTYYVSGNHEWWSNRMYDMFDYLDEKGVIVLRGSRDVIKVAENVIGISGIDDPEADSYDNAYAFQVRQAKRCPNSTVSGGFGYILSRYPSWEKQLKQVGEAAESDILNLLIAHRPEHAQKYFEYDFDVVLSGHAHGGQFRIPYMMNGLYAPNQGFFPKLAGGMYDFKGKKLIVSRGLARESTRLPRVFNRPELVFVNLIPS